MKLTTLKEENGHMISANTIVCLQSKPDPESLNSNTNEQQITEK
jgi:hypothetical protein